MNKVNSIIITALLISCYPLLTNSSWKRADSPTKNYDKILVMGLANSQDSSLSATIEDHLVTNLKEIGYNAVSSASEYGPDGFKSIREEETIKQLYPYDAVITIALLNKTTEIPCHSATDSNMLFWNYYSEMHDEVYSPGYYTLNEKYYWEINLYSLNNWKLDYSMQTRSSGLSFTKEFTKEYGKLIVSDMIKNNILQRKYPILKPF